MRGTLQNAVDRAVERGRRKVARGADSLLRRYNGDHLKAADVAWREMEDAGHGRESNYWGAVYSLLRESAPVAGEG